jgi:hypothetical protein
MEFFARNVRPVIILLGFLSSLMGTLGSFLFVEGQNGRLSALVDQKNAAAREIERLGKLAADYFMANQQGDLIYALGLQQSARKDVLGLIYQGNLLDRAEPVRNIIGALALAHQLDYRKTYDRYEKLNDAARKSLAFDTFVAVKSFEREVVERAQQRVSDLQLGLVPLQHQIQQSDVALRSRHLFMIVFASIGSFLLLVANLFEHRTKEKAPA